MVIFKYTVSIATGLGQPQIGLYYYIRQTPNTITLIISHLIPALSVASRQRGCGTVRVVHGLLSLAHRLSANE